MTAWKDQKSHPLKNGKAILLCCWVEMRGRGERGGVAHPSTCSVSRELLQEGEFPFGCRRKGWEMLLAGLLQVLCLCVDFFLRWQERCSPQELTSLPSLLLRSKGAAEVPRARCLQGDGSAKDLALAPGLHFTLERKIFL